MSPPPQRTPADLVAIREGAKEDFFHRHAKGRARALDAWASLLEKRRLLLADTSFGPVFTPPRFPAFLKVARPLRAIKGLPHAFRAVYVVIHDPADGVVVRIEWVGDHAEYDRLFGYTN